MNKSPHTQFLSAPNYTTDAPENYLLFCRPLDLKKHNDIYGTPYAVAHEPKDINRTDKVCLFALNAMHATHLYRGLMAVQVEPAAVLGMDLWPTDNRVDPEFAERHYPALKMLADRLDGWRDRDILNRILAYRSTGNYALLPFSRFPEYFHPEVLPSSGDNVVDGGAEGSTSFHFAKAVGARGRVFSFEPSYVARHPLIEKVSTSAKLSKIITVSDQALWEKPGLLNFETGFLRADRVVETFGARPNGSVNEIQATTIDAEFDGFPIDLIKLDVEGADKEALRGAIKSIQRHRPKIMVSLYHQMNDLFEIPELIDEIQPGYKMFLGHHYMNSWETTLYCIHQDMIMS